MIYRGQPSGTMRTPSSSSPPFTPPEGSCLHQLWKSTTDQRDVSNFSRLCSPPSSRAGQGESHKVISTGTVVICLFWADSFYLRSHVVGLAESPSNGNIPLLTPCYQQAAFHSSHSPRLQWITIELAAPSPLGTTLWLQPACPPHSQTVWFIFGPQETQTLPQLSCRHHQLWFVP